MLHVRARVLIEQLLAHGSVGRGDRRRGGGSLRGFSTDALLGQQRRQHGDDGLHVDAGRQLEHIRPRCCHQPEEGLSDRLLLACVCTHGGPSMQPAGLDMPGCMLAVWEVGAKDVAATGLAT